MPADPLAVRVARRHAAAVVLRDHPPKTRVDYDCSGSISSFDLRQALEPVTGWLRRLRLRPAPEGPSTTVAWEAVTGEGKLVTGTLVLRGAIREDEVNVWAEVLVESGP